MVKITSIIFELFNVKTDKYNCIYKKIHRNSLWPIRRNDVSGKSDNSVANRAELELLCRWIAAVLSNSKTNKYENYLLINNDKLSYISTMNNFTNYIVSKNFRHIKIIWSNLVVFTQSKLVVTIMLNIN